MARKVISPKFGAKLKQARMARGLTMGQVVARVHTTNAAGLVFEGFTQAQLSRYEAGQVKFPDPAILWRLAQLYGNVNVSDLIEQLTAERQTFAELEAAESPPLGARAARARRAGSR